MRFSAPLLTLAGTVAGTAAAVVAYQATAAAGPATRPASVETQDPAPAPAASTSWKPCERGWKIEGTACVRVKEKVVVVHDLPAPAAAPATTAGVRSATHSSGSSSSAHDSADDQNETEPADDSSEDVEHASDDGGQDTDGPDSEDVGSDD